MVIWVCDIIGHCGKSSLCKYLQATDPDIITMNNGACKDIACALPENPRAVLFDYTRSLEGRVNYSAIEQVKNGLMFSPKYESRSKIFNSPHVVCFANFLPNYDALSHDRWVTGIFTQYNKPLVWNLFID